MMLTKQPPTTWLFPLYAALFIALPWSLDRAFGSWHIRLPSEAFTGLLALLLVWSVLQNPALLRTFRHSRFLVLSGFIWFIWLTVSTFYSSMPLVSFKYFVVEAGHWWVFFAGLFLFPGWWRRLLPFFVCSMAGMVVFTLVHHFQYDFRADQSVLASQPFFPDHTLYSAILVMLLPILPFLFKKRVAATFALLFLTGLVFAACRAAWLSLLIVCLVLLPLVFRQKWKWLLLPACLVIAGTAALKNRIVTHISHDVSTLERLNRYSCALRMAAERPFSGFGPGTFQFQYLPFQQADEMTRISIRDPEKDLKPDQFGRGGGAHSEYFQALAENGRPGLAFWLLLVCTSVITGIHLYLSPQNKQNQWFALAVTASLLTFFIHALFNNFLHDGRLALLFWGQIAYLARRESSIVSGASPKL